jgi:hypothetical protein
MKFILIISLMCGLSACVKVSDAQPEQPAAKVESSGQGSPQPVATNTPVTPSEPTKADPASLPLAQVQALSEPGHYKVLLPVLPEAQIVHRSMVSVTDSSKLLTISKPGETLLDDQVESDHEYLYEQGVIQDGQFTVLQAQKVRIPKDMEIGSELILAKDETWDIDGRVFFYESGYITTNGFTFILKAGQLLGNSGTIRSFGRGSKAGIGQAGRSGGNIRIFAKTASGQLKVEMRGQNGGDGAKGADCKDWSKCPQAPIEYKTNGLAGFPGGDGMSGGNSGTFQIKLTEAHQLLVLVTAEYGLGGAGGIGGAGTAKAPDLNMQEGPPGKNGANGPSGVMERSYIEDLNGQRLL